MFASIINKAARSQKVVSQMQQLFWYFKNVAISTHTHVGNTIFSQSASAS